MNNFFFFFFRKRNKKFNHDFGLWIKVSVFETEPPQILHCGKKIKSEGFIMDPRGVGPARWRRYSGGGICDALLRHAASR